MPVPEWLADHAARGAVRQRPGSLAVLPAMPHCVALEAHVRATPNLLRRAAGSGTDVFAAR